MAIITRSITNNLNYSFTMLAPGSNTNQNANLIIPASAVNLDLLTLCTEDTLWALQPALLSLQRAGNITVTGTIDTSSFEYDGVASLNADSNPDIRGDVQLVSGTNITLSQTGQAITINASSGGGSPNVESSTHTDPSFTSYNTLITSVTITTTGGPVLLTAQWSVSVTPQTNRIDAYTMITNGSTPVPGGVAALLSNFTQTASQSIVFYTTTVDTPVAGTYTYNFGSSFNHGTVGTASNYSLVAVELK